MVLGLGIVAATASNSQEGPALLRGVIRPFTAADDGATPAASPEATPAASPEATPVCAADASSGRVVAVPNEVTIHLTDRGFDPATIQATSGHDLTITLINTGSRPHAFVLEYFGIDVSLAPGERETVAVSPGDRGDAVTYPFASDAPGDECMHGTLVFYV
jgi:hypothetical protein